MLCITNSLSDDLVGLAWSLAFRRKDPLLCLVRLISHLQQKRENHGGFHWESPLWACARKAHLYLEHGAGVHDPLWIELLGCQGKRDEGGKLHDNMRKYGGVCHCEIE